jgi:hypothetical protein
MGSYGDSNGGIENETVGYFKNLNKMKHQIKRHIEKLKEAS